MAANVTAFTNWSATASSNQPDGSDAADIDADLRQIQAEVRKYTRTKGSDIASASTVDMSNATGDYIDITGTTTITGFGTVSAGMRFILQFDDALTLTHNGTSLILPGAANITTATGDVAIMESLGSGNWKCIAYTRASGAAVYIADESVTLAKLQNISTSTILGRSTAGTGDVEELTGAQVAVTMTNAIGPLAGMRNLIINGNLAINQRGYVSGTNVSAANTYTLDRWRVVTSGQNVTFIASGNGNEIKAPAGGIEQVIEGVNIGGGTYVLNWTGTATATVNGTARAKGESFTLTANTDATVRLIGGTASLVQLEPGTVPTAFEHRPYGTELALCQRYYFQVTSQYDFYYRGNTGSALTYGLLIKEFPVTMRVAPTFSSAQATFNTSLCGFTSHNTTPNRHLSLIANSNTLGQDAFALLSSGFVDWTAEL